MFHYQTLFVKSQLSFLRAHIKSLSTITCEDTFQQQLKIALDLIDDIECRVKDVDESETFEEMLKRWTSYNYE